MHQCVHAAVNGEIISSLQLSFNEAIVRLTNREKEILALISIGKTTIEMAEQLYISKFTVESHRKNLLQKFGVRNVAKLIRVAADRDCL